MPDVVFPPRADAQMADALAFTLDRFGETKYLEYLALIHEAIEALQADPTAGKRRPEVHADAWTFHIARGTKRARHLLLAVIAARPIIDRASPIPRHAGRKARTPGLQRAAVLPSHASSRAGNPGCFCTQCPHGSTTTSPPTFFT